MSNYPAVLLKYPIAQNGDRSAVPETASQAGTGRISQEEGWGIWNSRPIGEGGIPPKREDFNSVLYLLSTFIYWMQQGGVMKYTTTLDYEPDNEVFHNGVKYWCLVANGAGTEKGVVAPGSDKTVWSNRDLPSVLAGQVTPFYNCKLGGSDGRRLIPWGSADPDESYVLCDGGSDGLGGNVPNLMDKFILPGTVEQSGQTGGSLTLSVPGVTVNGTVGETVLTVDQIPSHTHTGSTDGAGAHTHTRGTMEITGTHGGHAFKYGDPSLADGAFYFPNTQNGGAGATTNCKVYNMEFQASRNWTGATSSNGTHSHTITMGATGGGKGHTHTITSESTEQKLMLDRPPFYRLAFFVKLPE